MAPKIFGAVGNFKRLFERKPFEGFFEVGRVLCICAGKLYWFGLGSVDEPQGLIWARDLCCGPKEP